MKNYDTPPHATAAFPRVDEATTDDLLHQLQVRGWRGTLTRETEWCKQLVELADFTPTTMVDPQEHGWRPR